jgi:hypothetical protein
MLLKIPSYCSCERGIDHPTNGLTHRGVGTNLVEAFVLTIEDNGP